MTPSASRLAPSPTGALHLGNARTFLVNWALARRNGWRLLMRIEDLDGPRIKPEAVDGILETLAWLGLDWERPLMRQSEDLEPYRAAMRSLASQRLVFRSDLTRSQILSAASAPHAGEHEARFAPSLRPNDPHAWRFEDDSAGYRFVVPDETLRIDDLCASPHDIRPCDEIGDFIVWTKQGVPAYQLAVVVDDARQGVTHVVRGDDLLPSAARQTLLYRALRLSPPQWCHLPLVVGPDGKRLAKRHGDARLESYRRAGVPPERIIALLARWCGHPSPPDALSAAEFAASFDLARLSRRPICFHLDDHAWLLRASSSPSSAHS